MSGARGASGHSSASRRVARIVSIVGHPFVMALVMVLGVALHRGLAGAALGAALLVTAAALLPVAALMIRQVRRGAWGNADASDRRERPLLYGVGIGGLAVLLGVQLRHRNARLNR